MAQQTPAAKRAHKEYVDGLAHKVRAEIELGNCFDGDPNDDLCVTGLEREAQEMSTVILHALIGAFRKVDGTRFHAALFNGTLAKLEDWERELVDEALRERKFTQLARRATEYRALVTRAQEILVAHPYPIGGRGAAYEIRSMLQGMERDDQDMIDDARAQFSCEADEEPAYWYAILDRAIRDWRRKHNRR